MNLVQLGLRGEPGQPGEGGRGTGADAALTPAGHLHLLHLSPSLPRAPGRASPLSPPTPHPSCCLCFRGGKFESPAYWISFQRADKAEETSVAGDKMCERWGWGRGGPRSALSPRRFYRLARRLLYYAEIYRATWHHGHRGARRLKSERREFKINKKEILRSHTSRTKCGRVCFR